MKKGAYNRMLKVTLQLVRIVKISLTQVWPFFLYRSLTFALLFSFPLICFFHFPMGICLASFVQFCMVYWNLATFSCYLLRPLPLASFSETFLHLHAPPFTLPFSWPATLPVVYSICLSYIFLYLATTRKTLGCFWEEKLPHLVFTPLWLISNQIIARRLCLAGWDFN